MYCFMKTDLMCIFNKKNVWFRTFHVESVIRSTKNINIFVAKRYNLMELVKLQYYKEISIKRDE